MDPTKNIDDHWANDLIEKAFFDKLVFENDFCKFYYDHWCSRYAEQLNEYDEEGIVAECSQVLRTEPKDGGSVMYVAFDRNGKPFLDWSDFYDFDFKNRMYRMGLKEKNDIINMAKKVKRKKKVRE